MKRLLRRAYEAGDDLEKMIGYLVRRRSGLTLDQEHFDAIKQHFSDNGGHLQGLQESAGDHWGKLHESIDHVLTKHNLK